MDQERRLAEKRIRETVADADSPIAQLYVRESMKKNKVALVLFALALCTPVAFLFSFYYSKLTTVKERLLRDPYALPEGFDPNTGASSNDPSHVITGGDAPTSLILGGKPGTYSTRQPTGERTIS